MPVDMFGRRARFPLPGLAPALAALVLAGPAAAGPPPQFAAIMDQVFGRGAWRMTGGYRTPERENQLRAEGAKTVAPGRLSRHSLGSPQAPGAYDLVVDGMSPYEAAARLRRAGAPFARYQPKGAHGTQGPHLHLEPYSFDLAWSGPGPASPSAGAAMGGLPVVLTGYRRSAPPTLQTYDDEPDAPEDVGSPEAQALAVLRRRAMEDDPQAQLALGRALAEGGSVARDLRAARSWLDLAATNGKATPEIAQAAAAALGQVTEGLAIDSELRARRDMRSAGRSACKPETSRVGGLRVETLDGGCPKPVDGRRPAVVLLSGR